MTSEITSPVRRLDGPNGSAETARVCDPAKERKAALNTARKFGSVCEKWEFTQDFSTPRRVSFSVANTHNTGGYFHQHSFTKRFPGAG